MHLLKQFPSLRIDLKQETIVYYVCAVSVVITRTLTIGLINIFTARVLQILDRAELHFSGVHYNRSISGHGRTLPYAAEPGRQVVCNRGRQVNDRNRYCRNPLYEIFLKDGRRPEFAVSYIRGDGRNVLFRNLQSARLASKYVYVFLVAG